MNKAI